MDENTEKSEIADVDADEDEEAPVGRIQLVRDAVVFQVKLALDGIVDLLLLPLSFGAAVISFVTGRRTFYDLVQSGLMMDRRINLFGAAKRDSNPGEDKIEQLAERIEKELLREYEQGTIQASARAAIDKAMNTLRDRKKTGTTRDS